jgi:integrase
MTLDASGALTVDQARAKAKEVLAEVALGRDPQADKAERRDKDQSTMRALVRQYLEARKAEVRPRTLTAITNFLTEARYFGELHGKPLDQIKRRDVAACLGRIKARGPAHAKNARATLSGFFRWCMAEGFADDWEANPVAGTNKIATNGARERTLTDAELAAVWRASSDADDYDYGRIVRLLILTGCRRKEIGGMCWSWFSPDASDFTIPASHSKNHRPHALPLLPMCAKSLVPCSAWRTAISSSARGRTRVSIAGRRASPRSTSAARSPAGSCTTSAGRSRRAWANWACSHISSRSS